MADTRLDVEKDDYEDDGPANPESETRARRDGFPKTPVPVTAQSSLLDRTDRADWPEIPVLESE